MSASNTAESGTRTAKYMISPRRALRRVSLSAASIAGDVLMGSVVSGRFAVPAGSFSFGTHFRSPTKKIYHLPHQYQRLGLPKLIRAKCSQIIPKVAVTPPRAGSAGSLVSPSRNDHDQCGDAIDDRDAQGLIMNWEIIRCDGWKEHHQRKA